MQTTPKANNILGHFFALLGAVVMLAIATWVTASTSEQVQPLAGLTVPRTGHTATALSDGRILITGGRDSAGALIAASEIFDPETQVSSASAALNTARVDHSATVLVDGRVLIAGGSDDTGSLSSAEIFDPANPENGFQTVASPMTAGRSHHTATLLNNGTVLIAGGDVGGTAEIFDPTTQSFTPTLWNLTVARSGHTATLFTDDSVLLAGGNSASMELFTPLDQKFTLDAATMAVVRTGHWAFELSDTRLLLFQGDVGNSIDEFNPITDTISPKGSLDFHASSSTLLANGKVLVLGTDVSGVYNPDAVPPVPDFTSFDNTSVPNSVILPRSGQTSVQLPGDKKILISGGVDSFNQLMGQVLYNPAKIWTDKDDYMPEEPVILSGSGWKANEPVYLFAVDNETEQWTYEMTVNADSNGEFVLSPYFIVELRHLGVQFHVTAVGQSTMQADVYFTDTSNQITKVAYDRGPAVDFVSGAVDGPLGLQTQNSSSLPEPLTGSTSTNFVTITITSSSGTGRFDTTSGGTFTATSLTQTINSASPTNPSFPDFYYKDTAAPGTTVLITATVTAKGSNVTNLPLNSTATLTKLLKRQPAFSNLVPGPTPLTITQGTASVNVSGRLNAGGGNIPSGTGTVKIGPLPAVTIGPFAAGNGAFGPTAVTTNTLTPGTYTITYSYPGDTNYASATDTSTQLIVAAPSPTPTPTSTATATATATFTPTATATATATATFTPTPTPTPTAAATNLVVSAASGTYGGSVFLTATLTSNSSPVSGKTISFTLNGNPAGSGVTNASGVATSSSVTLCGSSYNVSGSPYASGAAASFAGDLSFAGSSGTNSLTVAKANAVVVVTPYDVPYDGNSHTASVTSITGVCGETGATVGMVDVTGTTHVSAAGSPYTDTWSFTGTGNYNNIAAGPATTIIDKINKINATWTTNPASKTYGDADPVPLTTGSGSGFTSGDAALLTVSYSRVGGENASPPTYHITATLGPADVIANYNITNNGAEFTINKRLATWTTNPANKTYGDADPSPLTTGSGSNFIAADNVTATYSRVAGENASPPTYHISATLSATPMSALDNYIITNAGAEFTINKRLATWTTNPASKTYGDADPSPLTTGGGTNFIAADNVTATYSRVAGENASPPTYHITATLSATPMSALDNYIITNAGAEFTIDKRLATWTTNPASKTYGDADPSPLTTGAGSGFIAADNVTATYTRVAGENASPPTYHITAHLSATPLSALDNYIITNDGSEFTINKRLATWTTDPNSKTYGDADPSPLTTGSGTNFIAADNVTATYSRVAGENASPPTYHITATLHATPGSALDNYIITNAGAEFTINKRLATWTTNPASKTYGDADPSPLTTGNGTNFIAADNVTASYSRVAGENASPPTYHITATLSATPMSALDNYIITNAGAEFTINKRLATWTTNPASKTYGDADPSPLTTGSGSNFVPADNVTATYSRVAGENASPPTYHITATLSATPLSALDNYIITNDGAEFTINKRLATWTTNAAMKTYGDLDPSPLTTGSGSNFVPGDNVTATYTRVAGENASPPTYHITATLSATPLSALDNYIITNDGAEFTINKRLATWTTDPNSKTYGNADPSPLTTGSGSNFVAADNVTATYTRAVGENASPPTYHITATLSATPMSALDNYIITNDGAEFTINKRLATWTTNPNSKTYGDADPVPVTTGSGSNFIAADNVTATYSRVSGENASPPTYHITATLSATPMSALDNYIITNDGAEFTIDKRLAVWTTNPASKTYGDADPAPLTTGSGTNFIAADNVTATYGRAAGENASPPTYHITATLSATPMSALNNYIITNAGAEFTIYRASLDITANNQSKIYGNTFTFLGTEFMTGADQLKFSDAVSSATLTSVGAAATATYTSPGPTYTINITAAVFSPTGAGNNYNITYHTGTLTLSQRQLDITANNRTKTYGATVTFAGTEFSTGAGQLVNGNTVTSVTLTSAGAAATATVTSPGPDYPITPSAAVGTGLGNYSVSYHDGNLHIDSAALTITATNRSKVFGATYTPDTTPPSVDFTVSGLLNSDTVTNVTLTCAGYPAAALPQPTPYPVVPSAATGTGLGNYTIGYVNGQFTIGYGSCTNGTPSHQILPPINPDGTSVWKVGSTVPVKFTVCDAFGNPISDPHAVFASGYGGITLINTVRGTVNNVNEATYTDIPDSAFRWSGGQWIFNMATSNLQKNATYTFRINLVDGSYIEFTAGTK